MFEMSLVFWYEGEALVLGVEFGACASGSEPCFKVKGTSLCFPAIFGFLGMFVDFRDFFDVMGVRAKPLY